MALKKSNEKSLQIGQEMYKLLFNSYYKKAYRIAYMLTKDHALAEDIVQESFIKAFRNIHQLKDIDHFASWFATIIKNTASNFFRKDPNTFPTNDLEKVIPLVRQWEQHGENLDDIIINKEMKEITLHTIMELNEKYRTVLLLYYYWEFSYENIANQLNINIGTVKSRLHKGRMMIKEVLEGIYEEGGRKQDGLLRQVNQRKY